jgi:hypothetical protein
MRSTRRGINPALMQFTLGRPQRDSELGLMKQAATLKSLCSSGGFPR